MAEAYSNLGFALYQKGQVDEAIAEYQKALDLNPGLADTHTRLGIALWQKGRRDEAIAQLQEVVRLNPHDSNAQSNLAKAQAMSRQPPVSK